MRVVVKYEGGRDKPYVLWVEGDYGSAPAGSRLNKGGDWPDIAFEHADRESAMRAKNKLQTYLDNLARTKKGRRR